MKYILIFIISYFISMQLCAIEVRVKNSKLAIMGDDNVDYISQAVVFETIMGIRGTYAAMNGQIVALDEVVKYRDDNLSSPYALIIYKDLNLVTLRMVKVIVTRFIARYSYDNFIDTDFIGTDEQRAEVSAKTSAK